MGEGQMQSWLENDAHHPCRLLEQQTCGWNIGERGRSQRKQIISSCELRTWTRVEILSDRERKANCNSISPALNFEPPWSSKNPSNLTSRCQNSPLKYRDIWLLGRMTTSLTMFAFVNRIAEQRYEQAPNTPSYGLLEQSSI